MNIKDIGGEFALIKRIAAKPKDKSIIKGIGDDAAVLKLGGKLFVITTDTLVENDHFSLKWFSPKQVGMKAIEINASDVGAMGGKPRYALVSLVLKPDTPVEFVDGLYKGMREAGEKHGIEIIGGNVTHGKELVIDIDMIGEVEKQNLCLRSNAKPGDFILVSGDAGKSTAALHLFRKSKLNKKNKNNFKKIIEAHTEPKARFDKVKKFIKYINAMIDVSDGIASDITRLCEQSNVGAVIYADNIPIADETKKAAKLLGENALDYALYGGEDFELVFTVSEKNLRNVKGFLIGEITKKKGVRLYQHGKEKLITKHGYDHFIGP
ncbi:thiamine-phosphate kinase [Candidatus Woesearchaeota archaeon]|nr:thiamine-phosphate kinase [Candidatus Woesearchaeota archaeon]